MEYDSSDELVFETTSSNLPELTPPEQLLTLIKKGELGTQLLDIGGAFQSIETELQGSELNYRAIEPTNLTLLEEILKGSEKGVYLIIGDLGQLSDPGEFLSRLAELAKQPIFNIKGLLIVAVNLSHQDIVSQLLAGHGLDRRTLLAGFTEDTLSALVNNAGWGISHRFDLTKYSSIARDSDLLVHKPTLVGATVRYLAGVLNPTALTTHFIWRLQPTFSSNLAIPVLPVKRPLLSVLVRTQAIRLELLTECLYSIYAQDCDFEDYEVLIALQSSPESEHPGEIEDPLLVTLQNFLANFPQELVERIRIVRTYGDGNAQPTNPLIEAAYGDYLLFLDDDDLILDGCFETYIKGILEYGKEAPILHTFSIIRKVKICNWQVLTGLSQKQTSNEDRVGLKANSAKFDDLFNDKDMLPRTYPYTAYNIERPWSTPYKPVYNHYDNQLPPTSYAFPRLLVEQTKFRFREEFIVFNDWEFLMRCTSILKVITLPVITSCVNIRNNNSQTMTNSSMASTWKYYYDRVKQLKTRQPLILDGSAAAEIVDYYTDAEDRRHRLSCAEKELYLLQTEKNGLHNHIEELREYIRSLEETINSMQRSPSWKLTGPLRQIRQIVPK
jgi:glycosyltransferase involved in cell wall biosynthesis